METLSTAVVGVFTLVGAFSAMAALYVLSVYLYYDVIIYRALSRNMGFRLGASGLAATEQLDYILALSIAAVVAGGVFEQAGFRVGDVLPDETQTSLVKLLQRNRGRTVELAVVDGGPGPRFQWRPRRVLRVEVPPGGRG